LVHLSVGRQTSHFPQNVTYCQQIEKNIKPYLLL
jgi:hypothetical protein